MSVKTYSEKLKDPRWQKKRLEVFEAANWQCQKCGRKDLTLHVHHLHYEKGKDPWEYENKDLKCLCEPCHEYSHSLPEVGQSFLPKFSFSIYQEDFGNILCPVCGDDYVHHESTTVIKDGEDGYKADPGVRGDVIEIPFWCENGHHSFLIKIGFHKGFSYIWTVYVGEKIFEDEPK